MTKKTAIIIGGLTLIVIIAVARSCRLTDKLSILEGQHEILTETANSLAKSHAELEAETKKILAAKDAEIAAIKAAAGKPTPAEIAKDTTIAAQQAKIATLEAQGDIAGALATAKAEIAEWASKFTLAEERHATAIAALDAAWVSKFNVQVKLTDSWKARYENEARLHDISRQELGIVSRKLQAARFTGTLKSGLVVALAGYLAYNAVKGKG